MRKFIFKSEVAAEFREELSSLLFFNTEQKNVAEGIIASIEKYGLPHIDEGDGKLKISVEKLPEIQVIYAFKSIEGKEELIGVMLFFRETVDCLTLLHIAVKEKYTFHSSAGESLLAVELLFKLKEIARQLKKVKYISIYYQKHVAKRLIVSK